MRFYINDSTGKANYIVCGQLVSESGFVHQKRCLLENVLIMVNEGTLFINTGGINYEVSKGQYILLRAGEWHYGVKESEGKLSYYWIHFEKDEWEYSYAKSAGSMPEYGSFVVNGRIPVLFHQLADIAFEEDVQARKMCHLAVEMILIELSRENYSEGSGTHSEIPAALASAIEYINRNYIMNISVTDLAEKYGYTPDYFSTLFKKYMGISTIGFINKVRINASKALLANYGVSIREVAYSCGFSDEKYFMRVFRQVEGMTPTEYRKNSRKAYINEE